MKSKGAHAQTVEDEIDFIEDSVEENFEMSGNEMDMLHSGSKEAIEFEHTKKQMSPASKKV
jgi:hypothetical protein